MTALLEPVERVSKAIHLCQFELPHETFENLSSSVPYAFESILMSESMRYAYTFNRFRKRCDL
jgi:hypothetical protein